MNRLDYRLRRLESQLPINECYCRVKHYRTMPASAEICPDCGGAIINVVIEHEDGFSMGRIGGEFLHYIGFSYADF